MLRKEKTRYFAEHLEKKFVSRPGGVTPTTPGDDTANAQDVQDRMSGSSSSMVPPSGDEPGSDECAAPVAKRCRAKNTENDLGEIPIPAAHSGQVVAASGQRRSSPEESCVMDTEDTRRCACCSSRAFGCC